MKFYDKPKINNVGALTSKVYAFNARPWEVHYTKTIDIKDSLCGPIYVEGKNAKILRLIPRYNRDLKLEWCSDIARYIHEANSIQRLKKTQSKNSLGLYQQVVSEEDQKELIKANLISIKSLDIVFGLSLDNESIYNLKIQSRRLGAHCFCEIVNKVSKTFGYLFTSTNKLYKLAQAKHLFLLGVNPRWETTNANLLFRFRHQRGNFKVFSFGNALDLTYKAFNFGSFDHPLYDISVGKSSLCKAFEPCGFYAYGDSLSQRLDANSMLIQSVIMHKNHNLMTLSTGANKVGASQLGFGDWIDYTNTCFVNPNKTKSFDYVKNFTFQCITPYLHHKIKLAVALYPIHSYLEKDGEYMRYDGLVQKAYKVLNFNSMTLQDYLNFGWRKTHFKFLTTVSQRNYTSSTYSKKIFSAMLKYTKNFKFIITCVKSLYGNMYASSLYIKRSSTLIHVSKVHASLYWPFILLVQTEKL